MRADISGRCRSSCMNCGNATYGGATANVSEDPRFRAPLRNLQIAAVANGITTGLGKSGHRAGSKQAFHFVPLSRYLHGYLQIDSATPRT